jgi:hypothetical protein
MYLASDGLRFSYPANKGTTGDWLGPLQSAPLPVLLDAATALGFDAVYVDRFGYVDGGDELADALDGALGRAVVRSADDRYLIWDLRDHRADLRARVGERGVERVRAAAAEPVRAFLDDGFGAASVAIGRGSRDAVSDAAITLENDRDAPRQVVLTTELSTIPNGASSATLRFPDGSRRRVVLDEGPVRVRHRFTVPAGRSVIHLVSRGAPEIDMRDTGSWHGAVGVPTTFEDRAVVRVTDASLVPVAVCSGQAETADAARGACTAGAGPQAATSR